MRDADELRKFAAEDWAAAQRDKELYWRDYKRLHGPAAGIRIADELRKQVLAQKPDWPDERERREDYAAHLRVIEALDRLPPRPRRAARWQLVFLEHAERLSGGSELLCRIFFIPAPFVSLLRGATGEREHEGRSVRGLN